MIYLMHNRIIYFYTKMNKIFNKFFLGLIGLSFVLGLMLSLNHEAIASIVGRPVVTAGSSTIPSGGSTTISWNSSGADGCGVISTFQSSTLTNTNFVGAGGNLITGSFSTGTLTNTTSSAQTITFTVRCATVDPPVDPGTCTSYYQVPLSACFTADTKIDMADGTAKNIQDVKIGDVLKGETTNNKVIGFHRPELDGKLYSLNGGRYFVTEEHPFKTLDGWKSINPKKTQTENIGITVTTLKIGDTLITDKGNVLLKTIDGKNAKDTTPLYNFFLTGDHTYYADGYLVHNKAACDATHGCGGQVCLGADGKKVGFDSSYSSGMCASCPGTNVCASGYTASCVGEYTGCTLTGSCGGGTGACEGTVAGSTGSYGEMPGPYEGMDCGNAFSTQAQCEQGWPAHGCHWNPTGVAY